MSFVPDEELKGKATLNLAPMLDFLFLLLAFFASLAVSRIATRDTDVDLVKIRPETRPTSIEKFTDIKVIHLSITESGSYKWVTEVRDHPMENAVAISDELKRQYDQGLLPEDKKKTQILLKIDKKAPWEPILNVLFAVRDAGFEVRPVYEPEDSIGATAAAPAAKANRV